MFPEERDDLPQEPEAGEEGGIPEGAPGEPGESTPSETAPEPAAPEGDAPEGDAPEGDAPEGGAVGPEIEGAEELVAQETAEGEQPEAPREPPARRERRQDESEEEVIPGMHLEPDLVLEEQRREESEFGPYAEVEEEFAPDEAAEEVTEEAPAEPAPLPHTPLDLAADARYGATGKRKSAVARVILKPGEGTYRVNGRHLDEYFPRVRLQRVARQPLEAAGYQSRMDVVARIHGGGVSAQAVALRHGVARALVEADPALRGELKRRGYLTRDPRVKERKKAGLKKARKRPQFSKR
jgi:small subunit ribosomal protein S9